MARFLSDAWFAEIDGAVGRAADGTADLILQQVVTDGPGGPVRYQVVVADHRAVLVPDGGRQADMTFTMSWDSAVAIARGTTSTQAALAAGRIRVSGSSARLTDRLAAVDGTALAANPVPAAVWAATTYDAPDEVDGA